jgi:hypothetical protein
LYRYAGCDDPPSNSDPNIGSAVKLWRVPDAKPKLPRPIESVSATVSSVEMRSIEN